MVTAKLIKPSTRLVIDGVTYECGDVCPMTNEQAEAYARKGYVVVFSHSDEEE